MQPKSSAFRMFPLPCISQGAVQGTSSRKILCLAERLILPTHSGLSSQTPLVGCCPVCSLTRPTCPLCRLPVLTHTTLKPSFCTEPSPVAGTMPPSLPSSCYISPSQQNPLPSFLTKPLYIIWVLPKSLSLPWSLLNILPSPQGTCYPSFFWKATTMYLYLFMAHWVQI